MESDNQPIETPEPLDEESVLREEDARAKYEARMEAMDRRDEAGPHWRWRGSL